MTELKPCPVCGNRMPYSGQRVKSGYWISCCDITVQGMPFMDVARDAWNEARPHQLAERLTTLQAENEKQKALLNKLVETHHDLIVDGQSPHEEMDSPIAEARNLLKGGE